MSDTPRTDAAMQSDQCCPNCEDFARALERELAIVHDLIKGGADWSNRYAIAADEREQWKRQAFEMQAERDAARKALAWIIDMQPGEPESFPAMAALPGRMREIARKALAK